MDLDTFLSQLSEKKIQLSAQSGKLQVQGPESALTPELCNTLTQYKPQILEKLSQIARYQSSSWINDNGHHCKQPDVRGDFLGRRSNTFPLTFEQERLWAISQTITNDKSLNFSLAVQWQGPLDIERLQRCLQEIIHRHGILRTHFEATADGPPVQVVHPHLDVEITVVERSLTDPTEQVAAVSALADAETKRFFNLTQLPLFHFTVLRFNDNEAALVMVFHHLIIDVSSMAILCQELASLYEAQSQGRLSPLPTLEIQYTDFVSWQQQWLGQNASTRAHAYWVKQLANFPTPATFPYDHPRSSTLSCQGTKQLFTIDKDLWHQFRQYCNGQGVTPFMGLLTILNVLIYRCSKQSDIVIGVPTSGRDYAKAQPLIGLFTYPMALRSQLSDTLSFSDLLEHIHQTASAGYTHQPTPEAKIVESLNTMSNRTMDYLYQVVFSYFGAYPRQLTLSQSTLSPFWNTGQIQTDLDLYIGVAEIEGVLEGVWIYNAHLFNPSTIAALMHSYSLIMQQAIESPELNLSKIVITSALQ